MKKMILGKSVNGQEIIGYSFGDINCFNKTLIIGGIHGNEAQSKEICTLYLKNIKDKPFLIDCYLLIIPALNPDGCKAKTRTNARGVDLNRNFPSNSWKLMPSKVNNPYYSGMEASSEPETKIIVDLLSKNNFKKVISIHTNAQVQNPNPPMINYDGEQSRELAEKLGNATGLIVKGDIGYPTPGSLGTWVGKELKKISVTVELDHNKSPKDLYKAHGKLFEVSVLS